MLSKEYLTKNTTPRNSASPPTHAKPFTPTNCSQSIFATSGRGGSEKGGDSVVGGCGDEMTGWGAATGLGGVTGAGVTIFGCDGGAEPGPTGFGNSFSIFNRATSDSSAMSRWKSSSMRFCARTARTISQIVSAIGIPKTSKTIRAMLLFRLVMRFAGVHLRQQVSKLTGRHKRRERRKHQRSIAAVCQPPNGCQTVDRFTESAASIRLRHSSFTIFLRSIA